MLQPTRFPLLALLFVSTLLAAAPAAEKQKPPASTKQVQATTTKLADDNEAPETATAPTKKIDLGADKFWQALTLLEGKDPAELTKGREALQAAADLEYPHAQTLLAECLMTGQNGFPKDQRKAANLYRLSAERGNAFAQVSLGQCLYSGTGIRKNREKAAEWLTAALDEKADYSRPTPPDDYLAEAAKKSAKNDTVAGELDRDPIGDCQATAHFLLGVIASSDKKADLAQKHFVQAATAGIDGRSGIYPAAVQAALNYAFGQGTPRDMTKANDMLATSRKLTVRAGVRMIHNYATLKVVDDFATADLEDSVTAEGEKFQTNTQYEIANLFTDKKSKDYNPAEAVKWFGLAAESGNVWAMLKLAFLYSGNELGKPDLEKAFTWFERAGTSEKSKHFLALANLAICHFNGIGTPKDTEKANALFKKYKKTEFICYLGSIGQCPTTILTWEQRVKLIEIWAKDKKDPQAQYTLGVRYRDGWDEKPDLNAAIRWFKKATKANHGPSWGALGEVHRSAPWLLDERWDEGQKNALECFKKGSDAGDAESIGIYAYMLSNIHTFLDTKNEVEKLYLRCLEIDPESTQANNNLAVIFEGRARDSTNTNGAQDKAKMFEYYEAAVRLKFALAAKNLGNIYSEGLLAEKDLRQAYRYYEQAAEWGMPEMHYTLGMMHEKGQGVPVTYSEAAYHYRLAALEGHEPSLRRLIDFYVTGKTGAVDFDRALFWLNMLARKRDVAAIATIVDLFLIKKEYTTAVKWLNDLSDTNNPRLAGFVYERLSRCYADGLGVKANPAKAKKYLAMAVELNDGDALCRNGLLQIEQGKLQDGVTTLKQAANYSPEASFRLGQLFFFGKYVEKDQAKALQLMRKAAEGNQLSALIFLASATYNRVPGSPSLDEAIRFAQQAEVNGEPSAGRIREKLEKRRDTGNDAPAEETARARSS